MPLTTAGKNAAADGVAAVVTHIGAYTDLGSTEVSGGSYARQAITWTAASGGVRDNNAQLSIPIPAGTTVPVVSLHSASTAGTLHGWSQIGSTLRGVATVDTAANDTLLSRGHGLAADNRIFFAPVAGESLPAGLSASTLYWVRSTGLTADAFTVSATQGGAAVDITGLGEAAWFRTVPETFSNAGNLIVATGALDLDFGFVG